MDPERIAALPILLALATYAFRLIRRSDAERDRYVRRLEYDRDYWRARALGEPIPPIPRDLIPSPPEEPS